MAHSFEFTLEEGTAKVRLDAILQSNVPDLSRTRLKSLIEEGHVLVDGAPCLAASLKVKAGMKIHVTVPENKPMTLTPQSMDLDIIFEDDDILVLNKPVGLVVHPAPGHPDKTLVNALLAHCGGTLSGIGGIERPGIVHRLDKGTSGLMVVAKNDLSHQSLTAQFSDRTLTRRYYAYVWGLPNPLQGSIDKPLGRSPHHRQKMAVKHHGGKAALTLYTVVKTFGLNASLVKCDLKTGRTHQIRVHLSSLGHGLLGDALYGSVPRRVSPILKNAVKELLLEDERPALHAYELQLRHPRTDEMLVFKVPMPEDLLALDALLEEAY
ncbi:MAG: RluA family pseudouridine synthase [Alphaproteobacteria bacterium]|nr:RluA family pseudouridine synthase [Alphaproteobacteria bacterium]